MSPTRRASLLPFAACACLLLSAARSQDPAPKPEPTAKPVHLFVLSGQSNMVGLRPEESFTPTVAKALGSDRVVVVKDAAGGQPMRRWFKGWKPAKGEAPEKTGDLYDRLMKKVAAAIEGKELLSVTFVWMQGERDAKEGHGDVYGKSMRGLLDQLQKDLGQEHVHFVIGRLSDFDMKNARYPDWTKVRDAQVAVAKVDPRGAWVDTDDLNDGENRKGQPIQDDLHYSAKGYVELGKRFAEAALKLLRKR